MKHKLARRLAEIDASFRIIGSAGDAKATGAEWDIVVIEEGFSKNGKFYPPEVLREATPLFEGAKVAAYEFSGKVFDHVPVPAMQQVPGGFAKNVVGFIDGVRFDESRPRKAIVARLHILESADWLRKMMRDAFEAGRPDLLGFSIDSFGDWMPAAIEGRDVQKVLKLDRVLELTVVTWPAAGGKALRLVASIPPNQAPTEDPAMDKLLLLLASMGAFWTKGFSLQESDAAKASAAVLGFLATHRDRILAAIAESGKAMSGEILAAQAQLAQMLQQAIDLLMAKKVDEAEALLKKLVAMATGDGYGQMSASKPAGAPARESVITPPAPPAGASPELVAQLAKLQHEVAIQASETRIEKALSGCNLPDAAKSRIRAIFADKAATHEQIQEAIRAEREYITSIAPAPTVTGCGGSRVAIGDDQREKYRKGMTAMLAGTPDEGGIPAFTSLHESFRIITGYAGPRHETGRRIMLHMAAGTPPLPGHDEVFAQHHLALRESVQTMGGYIREALATTDWAQVFGDSIRRALQKEYAAPPLDNWRKIVSDIVPLQDFRTNKRVRVGGFGDLNTVGELGTYTEKANPGDEEETYAAAKRGNLYSISYESIVNDDLGQVRKIPRMLGRAAARTLAKFVLKTNLADNPTVGSDGLALIHATHANNQTAALSEATLQIAIRQMLKQVELSSGERAFIMPKYLVVPPDLYNTAWELINSGVKIVAADNATTPSVIKNEFQLELVINPWQTDTNDWFLVADPRQYPTIEIGFLGGRQEPEVFVQDAANLGSVLTADKITYKIRHIYGGTTLDYRSFAGSIV